MSDLRRVGLHHPWRRAKGVSPVVATILLVAITVVLAAVLYIVVTHLAEGPSQTPLGSTFAFGTAINVTSSSPGVGCPANVICYSLTIATAGDGLLARGLEFGARDASGAVVATSGWLFTLISTAGSPVQASWSSGGGCVGTGCSLALTGGETISLDTGGNSSLMGDIIMGVGTGAFSGFVVSHGLPA